MVNTKEFAFVLGGRKLTFYNAISFIYLSFLNTGPNINDTDTMITHNYFSASPEIRFN